jgi:RND family efflux transporter MFP subunit
MWLARLTCLAASLAGMSALAAGQQPATTAPSVAPSASDTAVGAYGDSALPVEVITVAETPVVLHVSLTGAIEARDNIDAGFRLGGRVTEVLVRAGDRVQRDDPLARTDSVQQEQMLQVARSALDSAVAARDQARQAADRAISLLERGVGTRASRDAAVEALSTADGAVGQARAGLDQAQRALDDTVLRAPVDAVVTGRAVDPGQIVGPGQTVVSLAGLSGLEAVFQIPDTPLLDGAMGLRVTLTLVDDPDRTMTAAVDEISPLVDPQTGSVTVRAGIIDAPTDAALLGAAVRGEIEMPDGQGIPIPWTALTATDDAPAVWVVGDDCKVAIRPVVIDRFHTAEVLIASGLAQGERIVAAGSQLLYPGRCVAAALPVGSGADEE